jgi:hypothetical protein
MALPQRDALHHSHAEYLTWPEGGRNELISGTAYVREPPAPSRPGVAIDCDRLPAALP